MALIFQALDFSSPLFCKRHQWQFNQQTFHVEVEERKRQSNRYMYVYIYIYLYTYVMLYVQYCAYIFMYIYIYVYMYIYIFQSRASTLVLSPGVFYNPPPHQKTTGLMTKRSKDDLLASITLRSLNKESRFLVTKNPENANPTNSVRYVTCL